LNPVFPNFRLIFFQQFPIYSNFFQIQVKKAFFFEKSLKKVFLPQKSKENPAFSGKKKTQENGTE